MKRDEIKVKGIKSGWKSFNEVLPPEDNEYLILVPTVESIFDEDSNLLINYEVARCEQFKNEDGADMIAIFKYKEATGESIYYYEFTQYFYNGPIDKIYDTAGAPLYWMELPDLPER